MKGANDINDNWQKASQKLLSFGRASQSCEDYVTSSSGGDDDGSKWKTLVSRCKPDDAIALDEVLQTSLGIDFTLIEEDNLREMRRQNGKMCEFISNMMTACCRHIVFLSEQSKLPDGSPEASVLSANALSWKDAKSEISVFMGGLLKLHSVMANKSGFKCIKALHVWLGDVCILRFEHCEHFGEWKKAFGPCERAWKELRAIESGDGKWFLPGYQGSFAGPFLRRGLFSDGNFQAQKLIITAQRQERISKENHLSKDSFLEFTTMCSNTVISEGSQRFFPAFPSEIGGDPSSADEWLAIIGDSSGHHKAVKGAVTPIASIKTVPEKHSAWHLLDLDPGYSGHRRAGMSVSWRMSDTTRAGAVALNNWLGQDNSVEETKGSLTETFELAHDAFKIAIEKQENVKEQATTAEEGLKKEPEGDNAAEAKSVHKAMLPFVSFYSKHLSIAKDLEEGLKKAGHARLSATLNKARDHVKSLYMQDWHSRLATSVSRDERIRCIVKDILRAEPLAKHQQVELATENMLKLAVKFEKYASSYNLTSIIADTKTDDVLARRYLAGVACVQWTCCRKMQMEKGSMEFSEWKTKGEVVMQSIKDLKMYEPDRDNTVVLPIDIKEELDRNYKLEKKPAPGDA